MSLVQAKCENCGGNLEFRSEKRLHFVRFAERRILKSKRSLTILQTLIHFEQML